MYDLFTGTLPVMEVSDGESIRFSTPRSLFLSMMDDEVELNGQLYPIERTTDDEDLVSFTASFPLGSDVTVTGMTFSKADETLTLEIGSLGKSVTLERFNHMIERKANEFTEVDLIADISHLSDNQKELLGLLFQVADIMEEIYWDQVFPDRDAALSSVMDEDVLRFFKINYGPWERLNGNLPYLSGYGAKPAGSGYYPADMTREEFELLDDP